MRLYLVSDRLTRTSRIVRLVIPPCCKGGKHPRNCLVEDQAGVRFVRPFRGMRRINKESK